MQPGDRVEHYVLIEQIGQGGQAIVWSADDERLKRTVALKTINPKPTEGSAGTASASSSDEIARRFQDEARIIADLEHPAILPIYTFGQESESLYIVMRYMAGGSLKKLLQSGPLDLARAIKLARPLADALDLAHQRKIIHRDIKSANVLLDARNNLYLADFGLSVTLGDVVQPGAGTLVYMSPEQMMGDPLDHRSDLYAFGILLFEMLTGGVPLVGGQPWNLQQVMAGAEMPIPPDLPTKIADLLRKATSVKPEERYNSATEIIDRLGETIGSGQEAESEEATILPITDPALLAQMKANQLFEAALFDWADGAGRFRLYADDFKFIDSYYTDADAWSIQLNDAAHRLMLRAALEHGHNIETWWQHIADPAERRGIALQTLTSELAPARLRAMHYLAVTGDSDPPAIPTRVASIMSREPEAEVRLAGVALLEAQGQPSKNWRPAVFNESIDSTLADLAAHDPDRHVAEAAARACGRLRSTFAVNQLGTIAASGDAAAVRALTFVRDEVPALPTSVPSAVRSRVFLALSLRQMLAFGIVGRFLGAALGFIIGWGMIQFLQYNGRDLLPLQALGNAAASGVLYSLAIGLVVVVAAEPAQRLRAWNRLGRIVLSLVLGTIAATLAFNLLRSFYYFNTDPVDWPWLIGPSLVFIAGWAIGSGLTRNPWLRAAAGTVGMLLAVYLSWTLYNNGTDAEYLVFFSGDPLVLSALLAILIGLLAFLPEGLGRLWQAIQGLNS